MKKNLFWFVFGALFVISCSSSDESIPCVTAMDCPDSSFECIDGECVLGTAETTDDSDKQGGNGGGSETSDSDSSNGGGSSSDNDNGGNSGLPDPTSSDDEAKPDSEQGEGTETTDSDSSEANDGNGENSDSENNDGETADSDSSEENDGETTDGETDGDAESSVTDDENPDDDTDVEENPVGEVIDCTGDEDCSANINNKRCDPALHKCVICFEDSHCNPALGQNCDLSTHECISNATCAAAIAKLPYGGKFDWEDGTTQEFSTNAYWNLVNDPTISNGTYSFGQYSGYTDNMDYTSVLQPVDLSQCSGCAVNVLYYAKGAIPKSENGYDFIHPTCNGDGTTTAKNSTVSIQSLAPQSPWVMADAYYQKVNSYSTTAWTTSEWQIPASCKTDKFVFGLRFSSNGSISYATSHSYLGLVVDDLTIAPAATGYVPNGEFESAVNGYVRGWACDLDLITKNVLVKVEYYKNKDDAAAVAERWVYAAKEIAADPESPLATQCNATYNHGFEVPLDEDLKTLLGEDGTHKAVVYAVDVPSAENLCGGTYTKLGEREFEVNGIDPK